MERVDYHNHIIAPASGESAESASLAGPYTTEPHMPVTNRAPRLLDCVQRLGLRKLVSLIRLSRFLVVGVIGIVVNSLTLLIFFQWAHLPLVVASAFSAELAIVNNFYWNDRWTFKRTRFSLHRFAQFNLVSLGGLVITTSILWLLTSGLGLYYLAANLLAIALATVWNFVGNVWWTWGGAR